MFSIGRADAFYSGMNQPQMTLTNESITFTPEGIWIQPLLANRFRFAGTPADLIHIMIAHHELNVDDARFRVTTNAR